MSAHGENRAGVGPLPVRVGPGRVGSETLTLVSGPAGRVFQGSERYKFPNSNPFVEEDMDQSEVASVAYR